jgi:putative acyl-CoA dehydrogenase
MKEKHENIFMAKTHKVENQPQPLQNYNLYLQDIALRKAVDWRGRALGEDELHEFGTFAGSSEWIELGFQANENRPILYTHDRYGHRIDEVRFHPAYHRLMQYSIQHAAACFTLEHAGNLPSGVDCDAIIQRATPRQSAS